MEEYDDVRNTLAEARTIRKYTHQQWENGPNESKLWSYLDYLSFRDYHLSLDKYRFIGSSKVKLDNPSTIKENEHNESIHSTNSYEESLVPPLPPYRPGLKKRKGIPVVSFGHFKTQMRKPPQFWGRRIQIGKEGNVWTRTRGVHTPITLVILDIQEELKVHLI